ACWRSPKPTSSSWCPRTRPSPSKSTESGCNRCAQSPTWPTADRRPRAVLARSEGETAVSRSIVEDGADTEIRTVRSYCRICTAICGIVVDVSGDQGVRVRGDDEHTLSHGYTYAT